MQSSFSTCTLPDKSYLFPRYMMLANHDQSCGFLRNRVMTGCDYIWKIASSSEKDVGLAEFHLISTILICNNSVLPLISRVVLSQTELGLAQFFQPATLCTVWMCVSSDVELSQIHLHKGRGGKMCSVFDWREDKGFDHGICSTLCFTQPSAKASVKRCFQPVLVLQDHFACAWGG